MKEEEKINQKNNTGDKEKKKMRTVPFIHMQNGELSCTF